MTAIDRVRLGKVLGMLGSAHDGEVVTAARMATEMLKQHALDWDAVLEQAPAPAVKIRRVEVVREVSIEIVREVMVPQPLPESPAARLRLAAAQFYQALLYATPATVKLLLKILAYPLVLLQDHAGIVRQYFRQKNYLDGGLQLVIGGCCVSIAGGLWGGVYYGLMTTLGSYP